LSMRIYAVRRRGNRASASRASAARPALALLVVPSLHVAGLHVSRPLGGSAFGRAGQRRHLVLRRDAPPARRLLLPALEQCGGSLRARVAEVPLDQLPGEHELLDVGARSRDELTVEPRRQTLLGVVD